MKRKIAFLLALTMCILSLVALCPMAASAEETEDLKITHANMQFTNTVYLFIAVDYGKGGPDGVTVKITDKAGNATTLTRDVSVEETAGFPAGSIGFKYTDLGAKNLGDEMTIEAYRGDTLCDSTTYSILEYIVTSAHRNSTNADLLAVLRALQNFGAEAQKAYLPEGETLESAYDYPLADNEGNLLDYGLLVISGAEDRKVIKKVGETYTPTTTKSTPLLYDMDFNAMKENKITVPRGISRYFFIEDSARTPLSFDVSASNLSGFSWNYGTSNNTKSIYVNGETSATTTEPTDSGTYARYIAVLLKNGSGTGASLATGDFGKAIKLYRNNADIQFKTRLFPSPSSANNKATLGELFTFSITLGKEGLADMATGNYRFRGDGSKTIKFLSVSNNNGISTVSLPTGETLATIVGEESKSKFVTVHIVVDVAAGTMSYYVGGNAAPVAVVQSNDVRSYMFAANEKYGDIIDIILTGNGTTLIQKTMYTKGNIFK